MDILDLSLKKYITWENGYNLGESGIRSGTSGEVSSYIPVNEDEIIQYKTITRGNWTAIAFYDKDKNFVSGINESKWLNDCPFTVFDYNIGVVPVPSNAAFVRICRYETDYQGRNTLPKYLKDQYVRFFPTDIKNIIEFEQESTKTVGRIDDEYLIELLPDNQGVKNMVKNAYQMARIEWTPIADFDHNQGTFKAGTKVMGIPYSSTKEIFTYVPQYVSFESYMTAVNNPRSNLYKVKLDEIPYNGKNGRTYYGAVCSTLTSYACGLPYILISEYFGMDKELFEDVGSGYEVDKIKVGDLLQSDSKGHVMVVTRVWTNNDGDRIRFEITEEDGTCAISQNWDREFVQYWLDSHIYKAVRYRKAAEVSYTPYTDFVTLDGEEKTNYEYNKYLYPNRGNKSLYLENDEVVLNLFSDSEVKVILYKDDKRYRTFRNVLGDLSIGTLKYGSYKAQVKLGITKKSEFVYFKVVNIENFIDRKLNRIYFSSANLTPIIISFCNRDGGNVSPTGVQNNLISKQELLQGFKDFDFDFEDFPQLYFRIHCWDEDDNYGRIISRNINIRDGSESPF